MPEPIGEVWAEIPDTGCKGLCAEACGPILAGAAEVALLAERGIRLPDMLAVALDVNAGREPCDCPALVEGRCSVYDVRPTVCRLWGAVEDMPCPWGCVPDGGRLSAEDGHRLLRRAHKAV